MFRYRNATGATIAVTQPCVTSLGSTSQSYDAAGGPGSVTMDSAPGCNWTATTDSPSWLTVNSGSTSGTGPATIQYTVGANGTGAARTGNLSIGGQTFTVTQAQCTFVVSPTSQAFDFAANTGIVNVTTASTCASTATTNTPAWLTVTGGASGTGNHAVSYSITSNSGSHTLRTGTLTVAGQTVTITQDGLSAQFTAPTNGAAGLIPAVLHYLVRIRGAEDEDIVRFLLTAGAISIIRFA